MSKTMSNETVEYAADVNGTFCRLIMFPDGKVNYTGPMDNFIGFEAAQNPDRDIFDLMLQHCGLSDMDVFINDGTAAARAVFGAEWGATQ